MIKIEDEVEVEVIKTEKKIVKKEEVEYLVFTLKGAKVGLSIKDLIEDHPLLELKNSGLGVKAQVSIKISNPQTKIDNF